MSDYISGLRQDLVEAAARQQQRSPAARAARPIHPRNLSPLAVLGAGAALAGLLLLVLTLRAVSPPRPPEAPKIVGTFSLGGQPRDATAVGGALLIADLGGNVVRFSPAAPAARRTFAVTRIGTPQSVAADGDTVWVVSGDEPRSFLVQLDARTGRRLARVPIDGYASFVTVGAGGVWLAADLHNGGLARIDPRTHQRTLLIPKVSVGGLAATEHSVWVRAGATVTQRDARGRVVSRVGGISPTPGDESQRTMLADSEGAWVVGAHGILYRIERGRVVRRIALGETAGAIAGSGSTVWVSASPGVDRNELVRVDADDGKVTGRVSLGSHMPQAIVPLGKQVWVITSAGDALLVSPG